MLERRAVLQERADRIKEREARRKANLKRKEERVQKEREARHRMGIPTPPAKEGIQVGPSQLHLSDFMYAGVKRKRDDEEEETEEKSGMKEKGELVVQEQQTYLMEPPPSRQPLQLLSANIVSQRPTLSQIVKANPPKVRDFALEGTPTSQKPAPVPSKVRPFKQNTAPEDCFDDFFVSNTQIQRELSPPPTPTAKITPKAHPPTPPLASKPPTTDEATADLLALISTQDLDFTPDLTEQPSSSPQASPDLDSDFPDSDLDDIVLEFSLGSPVIQSSNATITPNPPPRNPDPPTRSDEHGEEEEDDGGGGGGGGGGSHYDSDSDLDDAEVQAGLQMISKNHDNKTQCQEAQRAAAAAAEWDAFDLSTQDLMELES